MNWTHCNCFRLSCLNAVEFNGGIDLTMFFTKNAVDIRPYFLTIPNGSLYQDTIILVKRSTTNFGEEVFMPQIDGEISVWVTSCFFSRRRFARIKVNIPEVIHGLRPALLYTFLVWRGKWSLKGDNKVLWNSS